LKMNGIVIDKITKINAAIRIALLVGESAIGIRNDLLQKEFRHKHVSSDAVVTSIWIASQPGMGKRVQLVLPYTIV